MSLPPGARLGSYHVRSAVGSGGMGEVYRATDPKLGREARVLASLNHTGIAHLYGFETAALDDGARASYLVMELVEGEDLAERLKRGPVPVEEVIGISKQVAEAQARGFV